jgi:hypothetical protein
MTDYVTAYLDVNGDEHEYTFEVITPLEYVEEYWSDTGWDYEIVQEPDLLFIEALDHEGEPYEPTKKQIDEASEKAYSNYYESKGFYS